MDTKAMTYGNKIVYCFNTLCDANGGAASPAEVAHLMKAKGWLSPLDTVIDIERLMKELRAQRRL
jgi:hypothetical protein